MKDQGVLTNRTLLIIFGIAICVILLLGFGIISFNG
jgi:hypothetical protein